MILFLIFKLSDDLRVGVVTALLSCNTNRVYAFQYSQKLI